MPETITDKKTIDVCFSPALLNLYGVKDKIVVVIDILRATSTICVALAYGAKKVIPVKTVEEAKKYKSNGYLVGAERGGKIVKGFTLGNSPFHYMNGQVKDKIIVLTTTNGTRAIENSKDGLKVVMGSFLNLKVLTDWLRKQDQNILLLCAGWKYKFNLEDMFFAGAVVHHLKDDFALIYDAAIAADDLYTANKGKLYTTLKRSSHFQRLASLGIEKDIKYCLTPNQINLIPIWEKDGLVKLGH